MMDWEKQIVRRTMEGAGDYPGVQLQFLLQRLEAHPDCVPAIADAIEDMATWFQVQTSELDAEARRRAGGADVLTLTPEGGAA